MPSIRFRLRIALGLIFVWLPAIAQSRLPVAELTIGMYLVRAEVAAQDHERQRGLMFREKLGQNEGMLFVFDRPGQVCMWMKNTPLALSVAFLDDSARIINIEDMTPLSLDTHCSTKPARYALEMNQGWFRQKNIKPGTVVGGVSPR